MPLQNRVTPLGEIVATSHRGTMFGLRGGCFHRADKTLLRRHWASKRWLVCVLAFKDRRRALMQPGRLTELFFLDEATALAGGHRPCFECRREAALAYQRLWSQTIGRGFVPKAGDMDEVLHAERMIAPAARPERRLDALPSGVFVLHAGAAHLWFDGCLRPWSFDGYGAPVHAAPATVVTLVTPLATTAILTAGYVPGLHASALASTSAGSGPVA